MLEFHEMTKQESDQALITEMERLADGLKGRLAETVAKRAARLRRLFERENALQEKADAMPDGQPGQALSFSQVQQRLALSTLLVKVLGSIKKSLTAHVKLMDRLVGQKGKATVPLLSIPTAELKASASVSLPKAA